MHGIHDVKQRDLAIELLDHLCTWERTKPLYERIIRELNKLGEKPRHSQFEREKYAKLREAEQVIPSLMYEIDAAKDLHGPNEFSYLPSNIFVAQGLFLSYPYSAND